MRSGTMVGRCPRWCARDHSADLGGTLRLIGLTPAEARELASALEQAADAFAPSPGPR